MTDDTLTERKLGNAFSTIELAVQQVVQNKVAEVTTDDLIKQVKKFAEDFIRSEYGPVRHDVILHAKDTGETKVLKDTVLHSEFDTILAFVRNGEPVFLCGPAGAGKNVICKQVADTLGLKFYFTNAVTQEYKLTGFTDAMGVFHESAFYKAFKNGGLFMLDEMDASIPETLIVLNSAIANGYFDFPAPIGNVVANPDFHIIAAGNTFGMGASYQYVGRNQLDGASLDRFAVVNIDYDANIEMLVGRNNEELVKFARDFRTACDKAGVNAIVSYRSIGRLAKMSEDLSVKKALKTCLVKNLEKDDLGMILGNIENKSGVYYNALKELKEEM